MVKARSAARVVQSYLARRPKTAKLVTVQAGRELPGGLVFGEAGQVILGTLGREVIQVLATAGKLLEDFANTPSNPQDILRFTRRYGVLHQRDVERLEVPGEEVPGDDFFIHCTQWLESQARIREQWARRDKADNALAEAIAKEINPRSAGGHSVKALIQPDKRGFRVELHPDDLLGAIWLAFVGFSDRARKCQNPTCPTSPYFLASRRDQKFCDENCARLVAKRRWWSKQGARWRERRKLRQSSSSAGGNKNDL